MATPNTNDYVHPRFIHLYIIKPITTCQWALTITDQQIATIVDSSSE